MIWLLFDYKWSFFLIFILSLILITSIEYFKFKRNAHNENHNHLINFLSLLNKYIKLSLNKIISTLFINENYLLQNSKIKGELNLQEQNFSKKNLRMSSFERRQSFIKHSQEEKQKRKQRDNSDSFFYSSIFSFTKSLVGYNKNQQKQKDNPKTIISSKNGFSKKPIYTQKNLLNFSKSDYNLKSDHFTCKPIKSILEEEEKNYESIDNKNLNSNKNNVTLSQLQIIDEIKCCPIKVLHHQISNGSSNSSTPTDLNYVTEKSKINGSKLNRKLNPIDSNTKPIHNDFLNKIKINEDINREYLLHQLNPNQYHRMNIKKNNKLKHQDSENNSDLNDQNQDLLDINSNLISSSSNSSCSECGSLDTEEELTLPFIKNNDNKANVSFCKRDSFKISSNSDLIVQSLTKQCSSDSNEAMVGLLNENLIKRQFSNSAYSKLNQKHKKILGRRLTAQYSSTTSGSSFNNSSNNSSFDQDDNFVHFNGRFTNSNSSADSNQFHYLHYEDNLNSNDSSGSSCSTNLQLKIKQNSNSFNCKTNQTTDCFEQDNETINNKMCTKTIKLDKDLFKNTLEVSHAYDPTSRKLIINVLKVEYPFSKKSNQLINFYVKAILHPNRRHNFKTSSKPCINGLAQFNEDFFFNRISSENIMSLSIKYTVYSEDKHHKRKPFGEAWVQFANKKPLQQEEKIILKLSRGFDTNIVNNYKIAHKTVTTYNGLNRSISQISNICRNNLNSFRHALNLNLPELLLGLAYNATTGRLQVGIIRGSQFKASSTNKPPDTFVKCALMSSAGREIGRSKTTVKRAQPNPIFKQTFAFQVALFQLPDVSLIVSVYNKKSMNRKETIGFFSLGCKSSTDEESSHWNEMRDSKGEQICRWHILSET